MSASPPDRQILLVHSHYGAPPGLFALAEERGLGAVVRERDLTREHFNRAFGLVTTSHLDQIGFLRWSEAVQALLDRGGRWFCNGHIVRELIPGLRAYVPIAQAKRADLVLTAIAEHPIFEGVERSSFEESRGVAGFYGRGHNPPPDGAAAITGVGPERLPLDWEWTLPSGGRMFSHAGNDMGGMGGPDPAHDKVAPRILDWTLGRLS